MASWFNSSVRLTHVTPLPPNISPSKAISVLQEHEFFIKCNPHMVSYSQLDISPDDGGEHPKDIPAEREVTAVAPPKCFEVVDRVHTLPAGLWDADVSSTYEFIDVRDGMFVRIRSQLGVSFESVWEIRLRDESSDEEEEEEDDDEENEGEDKGKDKDGKEEGGKDGEKKKEEEEKGHLELVEEITISCPFPIMGTIQSTCEEGWQGVHEKMVARFKEVK